MSWLSGLLGGRGLGNILFGWGHKTVERTYKKVVADPALTTLVAGTGPGTVAYGAQMMKMMEPPPIPPPPPTQVSAPYAGEAERQRRKRRKGYGSTILAGGQTLGEATTHRKTILGG